MPRSLTALFLALLLAGCEKPLQVEAGEREDTSTPLSASERRSRSPRGPSPGSPPSPREIMETAEKLESAASRERAFAEVAWNAMETDPDLAHEAFERLATDSPEKIRLLQHYAMTLAESDVDAALEWANSLGSAAQIAAAKAQIALTLAETDPRRAASLLSESGIAGREFDVAVVQVIQRWAAQSAPDAATWVASFPPSPVRIAGITEIAGKWLAADPPAAFGWLGRIEDEQFRAETARAMQGVVLQQPAGIQKEWLEQADDVIRAELERQRDHALLDVGDNIPAPETE